MHSYLIARCLNDVRIQVAVRWHPRHSQRRAGHSRRACGMRGCWDLLQRALVPTLPAFHTRGERLCHKRSPQVVCSESLHTCIAVHGCSDNHAVRAFTHSPALTLSCSTLPQSNHTQLTREHSCSRSHSHGTPPSYTQLAPSYVTPHSQILLQLHSIDLTEARILPLAHTHSLTLHTATITITS